MTKTSRPLMLGESSKPVDMLDAFDLSLSLDAVINLRGYSPAKTVGNRWRKRYQQLTIVFIEQGKGE